MKLVFARHERTTVPAIVHVPDHLAHFWPEICKLSDAVFVAHGELKVLGTCWRGELFGWQHPYAAISRWGTAWKEIPMDLALAFSEGWRDRRVVSQVPLSEFNRLCAQRWENWPPSVSGEQGEM